MISRTLLDQQKKKLNLKSASGLIFFLDFFGKILILGLAKIYIYETTFDCSSLMGNFVFMQQVRALLV